MQDARYFRDQAALCLEIARQVSDRQFAANLRLDAAQYVERAAELERGTQAVASPPRSEDAEKR